MKNTFTLLLAAAFCLSFNTLSFAQSLRFGLKGGIGLAKFDYEPDTTTESTDYFEYYYGPRNTANSGHRLTYTLAGVAEYNISKNTFLSSGLQASLKFSQFNTPSGYGKELNQYRFNVLYLKLPVTFHYRLGKLFLGAGTYTGLAIAGKWNNEVQNDGGNFRKIPGKVKFGNDDDSNLQRMDFGARAELGFGLKRLRLSLTLDQGLAQLKASSDQPDPKGNYAPFEQGKLRNQAIYATATYYWLAK